MIRESSVYEHIHHIADRVQDSLQSGNADSPTMKVVECWKGLVGHPYQNIISDATSKKDSEAGIC